MHTEDSLEAETRLAARRQGINNRPEEEFAPSEAVAGVLNAAFAAAFVWALFAAIQGSRYLFAWLLMRGHSHVVLGAACAALGIPLGRWLRPRNPRLFGLLQIIAGTGLGAYFGHRLLAAESNVLEQIADLIGAIIIVSDGAHIPYEGQLRARRDSKPFAGMN
jgi:hypothetical protein